MRLLLEPGSTTDDVRDVARNAGWQLEREYPFDPVTREPLELVWSVPGCDGDIHYVHDSHAGFDYFFRGLGDLETMNAAIVGAFDIRSESDIADDLDSAVPLTRARAIVAVGLSAARVPEEVLRRLINDALADPEPLVREHAILAIAYLDDRRWIPVLEEVASADPDPGVVDEALRIAEGLGLGTDE